MSKLQIVHLVSVFIFSIFMPSCSHMKPYERKPYNPLTATIKEKWAINFQYYENRKLDNNKLFAILNEVENNIIYEMNTIHNVYFYNTDCKLRLNIDIGIDDYSRIWRIHMEYFISGGGGGMEYNNLPESNVIQFEAPPWDWSGDTKMIKRKYSNEEFVSFVVRDIVEIMKEKEHQDRESRKYLKSLGY